MPDAITYTSVIAACAKGGEAGGAARALQFLEPPSPTTLPLGGTWQFAICGKLTPVALPNTPARTTPTYVAPFGWFYCHPMTSPDAQGSLTIFHPINIFLPFVSQLGAEGKITHFG